MRKTAKPQPDLKGTKPPENTGELGYDAWLAAEIEAGCAELDAGKGVAAEQVWKDLGLE